MNTEKSNKSEEPCTESKLLALYTSTVCLARTLAKAGVLDKESFKAKLASGRQRLELLDPGTGHYVQAFDELLPMLMNVWSTDT